MSRSYYKDISKPESDKWEAWHGSPDDFRMFTSLDDGVTYAYVECISEIGIKEFYKYFSEGREVLE